MKKTKFSVFIDSAFYRFMFFLVFLSILNFFVKKPYSLILAITFSLSLSVFTTKGLISKYKAERKAEKEKERYSEVMLRLNLMKSPELSNYFSRLLQKLGKITERKKGGLYCEKEETYYFFKFGYTPVNKADVVKYFNRLEKNQKAVIISENFDKETVSFSKRFGGRTALVSGRTLYKAIADNSAYPPAKCDYTPVSEKQKPNLRNLTDKKRVPKLIVYGTVFLLLSFIVPYKIFYVITGCITILFALAVLIFSKKPVEIQDETNPLRS